MQKLFFMATAYTLITLLLGHSQPAYAESQTNDYNEYKGITDPFGDPANYEFAEDEKEDKEFFHLGRFLMFGIDAGAGIFTGGLGATNSPGFYIGAHLIYFFDRQLAIEIAGHYAFDIDNVKYLTGGYNDIDTTLIPITMGFRYYFDTQNAPKAIAVANPYLAIGGGMYIRSQVVTGGNATVFATGAKTTTGSFGANAGGGVQFLIYRKHIYLGMDLRYHFIFFPDANATYPQNGTAAVAPGSRSGGYFTSAVSITYNF